MHTTGAGIKWNAWRENDTVFLSVADNGPGANNEQVKALYDETVASRASNGLGLHIVRDLAKAIGCKVTLQPQTITGTVFVLSI
jgi:K+-sensing histidine kinase KdpD